MNQLSKIRDISKEHGTTFKTKWHWFNHKFVWTNYHFFALSNVLTLHAHMMRVKIKYENLIKICLPVVFQWICSTRFHVDVRIRLSRDWGHSRSKLCTSCLGSQWPKNRPKYRENLYPETNSTTLVKNSFKISVMDYILLWKFINLVDNKWLNPVKNTIKTSLDR